MMTTVKTLKTVGDLINYLKLLGKHRILIYKNDYGIHKVDTNDFILEKVGDNKESVSMICRGEF